MGTLLTRLLGGYGMLTTGVFGGLVSSASTTAAAAYSGEPRRITAPIAGSTTVLACVACIDRCTGLFPER